MLKTAKNEERTARFKVSIMLKTAKNEERTARFKVSICFIDESGKAIKKLLDRLSHFW